MGRHVLLRSLSNLRGHIEENVDWKNIFILNNRSKPFNLSIAGSGTTLKSLHVVILQRTVKCSSNPFSEVLAATAAMVS